MIWNQADLAAAEAEVAQRLHGLSTVIVRVLVRAASRNVAPPLGRGVLVEAAVLEADNFKHLFRELS